MMPGSPYNSFYKKYLELTEAQYEERGCQMHVSPLDAAL